MEGKRRRHLRVCFTSSISRRNTRLGFTLRTPSKGGMVNSNVASTPRVSPCSPKDQFQATFGSRLKTLRMRMGNEL